MKIENSILCDDIRQEINGKTILIGIYSGDIVVNSAPFSFNFSCWVQVSGLLMGEHKMLLRLLFDKEEIISGEIGVNVIKSQEFITLPMGQFMINQEKLGELCLQIKYGKQKWTTALSKKIIDPSSIA